MMGADGIPGVLVSQACSTSTISVYQASVGVEAGLLAASVHGQSPHYVVPWKHVLTHRDLYLHPVRLHLPAKHSPQCEGQWVDAQDWPQLGLPAPVRLLLEGAKG